MVTFVLLGSLAEKLGLPLPWCCRRRPHDDKVCNRRSTVCLQNVNFLISAREMFSYQAQMFSLLLRILNSGWNSLNPFHNACKGPNPSVYIESDFDALMWLCRAWIYWIEPALHGGQTFAMSFTTMRCFMISFNISSSFLLGSFDTNGCSEWKVSKLSLRDGYLTKGFTTFLQPPQLVVTFWWVIVGIKVR